MAQSASSIQEGKTNDAISPDIITLNWEAYELAALPLPDIPQELVPVKVRSKFRICAIMAALFVGRSC